MSQILTSCHYCGEPASTQSSDCYPACKHCADVEYTKAFNQAFRIALQDGVWNFKMSAEDALDYILEVYPDSVFSVCNSRTHKLLSASIDVTTNSGYAFIVYITNLGIKVVHTKNGETFH